MRKLFYENSHLQEFTATVTDCWQTEKGWIVTLDATAFYPTGGGQDCDLGTLGTANVLDVKEQGDEIIHLCDGPLEIGSTVEGSIDWERRFDHMQQHAGDHSGKVVDLIVRLHQLAPAPLEEDAGCHTRQAYDDGTQAEEIERREQRWHEGDNDAVHVALHSVSAVGVGRK